MIWHWLVGWLDGLLSQQRKEKEKTRYKVQHDFLLQALKGIVLDPLRRYLIGWKGRSLVTCYLKSKLH